MSTETPEYWRGYRDCRSDLRSLLGKNKDWSAESKLAIVISFLLESDPE